MLVSRRIVLATLAGLALVPAALLSSGCPGNKQAVDNTAAPGGGNAAAGQRIKAGLVTDTGGVGDRSFNAAAWEGLQRAEKELGAQVKFTESKQAADYVGNLSRYAQNGFDVVFAVGFLMQDALAEVAPRFPKVMFAIVDGDAPDLPNCMSLKFREEEGSFLAGALAGAMTKNNTLGFVGGMEVPLIKKFEAGYKAGIKTTNPQGRVLVGYAGSWTDPQKGQEIAIAQMGSGADIIYHAAGQTGIGVITAAKNRGAPAYAIGVDKDQDDLAPGRVLTSMVKRVDTAVFDTVQAVQEGAFEPGTRIFGLKEQGVGLSPMRFTKQDVPADVLARIEKLRAQIIAGTLKPPTSLEELDRFQAPR